MHTNDLNRRIRYALSLDDRRVLELYSLTQFDAVADDIAAWRKKQGEEGFIDCPAEAIDALLNGLIHDRRGPPDDSAAPAQPASSSTGRSARSDLIDNNRILKQIRIALSLKTDDVHRLISTGGGTLTQSQVNALFRKPSARNYRRCGDQVLRWFLAGLSSERVSLLGQ